MVLWAVVLVPMWLKSHDRANELAAADRFAGAMRTLARRPGRSTPGRYVMMPARSAAARAPHVSAPQRPVASARELRRRSAETPSPTRDSAQTAVVYDRAVRAEAGRSTTVSERIEQAPNRYDAQSGRAARKARIARRRQLVVGLAASFLLTLLLAIIGGGLFVVLQVFVDVLVLAGLAHLRAQAMTDRAMARRARRARRRAAGDGGRAPIADRARTASPPPVPAESYLVPLSVPSSADVRYDAPAAPRPYVEPAAYEDRDWAYGDPAQSPGAQPAAQHAARPDAEHRVEPGSNVAAEAVGGATRARTVDLTQPGKWSAEQAAARGDDFFVAASSSPVTAELMADQLAEAAALAAANDEAELEYLLDRAVGE